VANCALRSSPGSFASLTAVVSFAVCADGCTGSPDQSAASSRPSKEQQTPALDHVPLLDQPKITVGATGLVQIGRHVEAAALVTNGDPRLDGRNATVTLVAYDRDARVLTQRTIELAGIPADTTIAVSEAMDLDSDAQASQVRAFVGFADAAVRRLEGARRLEPSQIEIRQDGSGALSVSGRVEQRLTYPGRYRVDAVLVDRDGAIVASARAADVIASGPDATSEWASFTARGRAKPGVAVSDVRPVVTIMPLASGS
jgi:hypothetical protein